MVAEADSVFLFNVGLNFLLCAFVVYVGVRL